MNENDLESPGYEYLRSYQNMNNLYQKLLALDYQRDFCPLYKCPPIHRYYFSIPKDNSNEQLFIYTCLCAWLIKDKCHMNLELTPEEYEDLDVTINVILEALELLLVDENSPKNNANKSSVRFPPGRLKSGYGPEVIWTLNILADRALELMLEDQGNDSSFTKRPKLFFYNKTNSESTRQVGANPGTNANYITIGQPFVGGGLTTRPLGSYQVNDKSLLFDDEQEDILEDSKEGVEGDNPLTTQVDADEWYQEVQRGAQLLETGSPLISGKVQASFLPVTMRDCNWDLFLRSYTSSSKALEDFFIEFNPLLDAITNRIDRQMQVIRNREKFIQTNLAAQLNKFLIVWRSYSKELNYNNDLIERVMQKTDLFESKNEILMNLALQIENRIKELNDGSKLRELQTMIDRLKRENVIFDVEINFLLTRYSKLQDKIRLEADEEEY